MVILQQLLMAHNIVLLFRKFALDVVAVHDKQLLRREAEGLLYQTDTRM